MEVVGGDRFQRCELVHAGVVYQDIQLLISGLGFREQASDVVGLGDVGLDSDRFAPFFGDMTDDVVGARLAGGVIDDDGGAFGGEMFRDRSADSLRRSSHNSNFPSQFAHGLPQNSFPMIVR